MTMILCCLAAAGWAIAIVLVLTLPGHARRRAKTSSLLVRGHVEPLLLRRADQCNLRPHAVPTDPSQDAEEILQSICRLADRLTAAERSGAAMSDTMNMAVSDTMPIDTSDLK